MQTDWDYVKRSYLWEYDELIKKLRDLSAYPTLWRAYNHDMPRAVDFAHCLFPNRDIAAGEYPASVIGTMERLADAGVEDWGSLLPQIATRDECVSFIQKHRLGFREFIDVLGYLLRWGLPFKTATREIFAHESCDEMAYYPVLKRHGLMNTFSLLEQGNAWGGRRWLSALMEVPLGFLTSLVHRADIARLPFVRRKTIMALCGAGYDTLSKVASADIPQMEADLDAHFRRTQGKGWENFRSVIVPAGMIAAARALPPVVDQSPKEEGPDGI